MKSILFDDFYFYYNEYRIQLSDRIGSDKSLYSIKTFLSRASV